MTLKWEHDRTAQTMALVVTQSDRFEPFRFPLRVDLVDETGTIRQVLLDVPATRTARIAVPGRWVEPPQSIWPDPYVELLAQFRTP